jgi:hypothetical protein
VTAPTPTDATTDGPQPAPPRRRRRLIVVAVLITMAVLAVVLLWFQPQVLLYDTVVEDDFPTAAPPDEPAADAATLPDEPSSATTDRDETDADAATEDTVTEDTAGEDPTGESTAGAAADADTSPSVEEPVALATGSFASRNRYTVTGGATTYELPDATRILRLEGFESTNGPDLFVYLTVGDASESNDAALAADYVDLGVLRGNVGDQNYAIPDDVDLTRFDTVVIWCRRFSTAFGAADLR